MPHNLNCSHDIPPNVTAHFKEMSVGGFVMVGIYAFLILLMLIIYLHKNMGRMKYLQPHKSFQRLRFVQAVYVIYAIMACIALISPRSSIICELVFVIYLSVSLKEFMYLMLELMESDEGVNCEEESVSLAATPIACCCWLCCPRVKVKKKFILCIKIGIYQAVVLRPLLAFVKAILWTNGYLQLGSESTFGEMFEFVNGMSILFAMYAFVLMYNGSKKFTDQYHINVKFICIQLVMLVACGQQNLLGLLAKVGAIPCIPHFSAAVRAEVLHHIMVIPEMFFLLIISSVLPRSSATNEERNQLLDDKNIFA